MYENVWAKTERYENLQISLKQLEDILGSEEDWIVSYINEKFSSDTFMGYNEVKRQLNFVGIKINDVADDIFYVQGDTTPTIDKMKKMLDEIYNRRNCIAHQSDRNRRNAIRNSIQKNDVDKMIDDIEKAVNAIHERLKKIDINFENDTQVHTKI